MKTYKSTGKFKTIYQVVRQYRSKHGTQLEDITSEDSRGKTKMEGVRAGYLKDLAELEEIARPTTPTPPQPINTFNDCK